jgi:hypothetical protein
MAEAITPAATAVIIMVDPAPRIAAATIPVRTEDMADINESRISSRRVI